MQVHTNETFYSFIKKSANDICLYFLITEHPLSNWWSAMQAFDGKNLFLYSQFHKTCNSKKEPMLLAVSG